MHTLKMMTTMKLTKTENKNENICPGQITLYRDELHLALNEYAMSIFNSRIVSLTLLLHLFIKQQRPHSNPLKIHNFFFIAYSRSIYAHAISHHLSRDHAPPDFLIQIILSIDFVCITAA